MSDTCYDFYTEPELKEKLANQFGIDSDGIKIISMSNDSSIVFSTNNQKYEIHNDVLTPLS